MVKEADHPGQVTPFMDGYVNLSVVLCGVGQAEGGLLMFLQSSGTRTWVIKQARVELGCITGRQVLTCTNDLRRMWEEKREVKATSPWMGCVSSPMMSYKGVHYLGIGLQVAAWVTRGFVWKDIKRPEVTFNS